MPDQSDAKQALDALRLSGFQVNAEWEKAHQIAQAHEGERVFDAIHALCHRIENDLSNAAYWDRRAGTDFGGNGPADEFSRLTEFIRNA